jgi:dTDP-4-dehydrorhamnose reductase
MGCLLDNLNWGKSQTEFLILGSGFISQAYQKFFDQNEIFYTALSRTEVNYTDYLTLKLYLTDNRPKFLINAAGYTGYPNVDSCEKNRASCYFANVELPLMIAGICEELDIPWGHISSGCVFTGDNGGKGFTEEDEPNFSFKFSNCSYYSGTKELAEKMLDRFKNLFIWRIRMPFNNIDHPKNYLSKILKYNTLVDVTNSLSNIDDFVWASYELVRKQSPFGIYNICNSGSISTRRITEIMQKKWPHKNFSFFPDYEEFEKVIVTPRSNCILNTEKLAGQGIRLHDVDDVVRISIRNWK